jgi:hypothetical protein
MEGSLNQLLSRYSLNRTVENYSHASSLAQFVNGEESDSGGEWSNQTLFKKELFTAFPLTAWFELHAASCN